ncbi:MAG TPA: response regulator [Planctomycetota bacterium]|nr:response regulator [Planctomycetota bacterium]
MAKRILVVDDEPGLREMIAEVLTDAGYEVTAEARPNDALRHMETVRFDLVISDFRMPDLQGDTFFHLMGVHISGVEPAGDEIGVSRTVPPVLIITGYGEDERVQRWCSEPGVAGVLLKPFRMDALLEMVAKALAGRPEKE